MKIKLQKYYEEGARFGVLLPEYGDEESEKFVDKLKLKETIVADFKKPRNYEFHKKWFHHFKIQNGKGLFLKNPLTDLEKT